MRTAKLLRTKKGREAFTSELLALCAKLGVSADREVDPHYPREIKVRIAIGHYRVTVDFDGEEKIDGFMANWYTDVCPPNFRELPTYPRDFTCYNLGSINDYHWGKATTVVSTFEALLLAVERSVNRLKEVLDEARLPVTPSTWEPVVPVAAAA